MTRQKFIVKPGPMYLISFALTCDTCNCQAPDVLANRPGIINQNTYLTDPPLFPFVRETKIDKAGQSFSSGISRAVFPSIKIISLRGHRACKHRTTDRFFSPRLRNGKMPKWKYKDKHTALKLFVISRIALTLDSDLLADACNRFSSLPRYCSRRRRGKNEKKKKKKSKEKKEFDSRYNINFYEWPRTCAHTTLSMEREGASPVLRLFVERDTERSFVNYFQDKLNARTDWARREKVGRFLRWWYIDA